MTLLEKIISFARYGDIVMRARDPETHEPIPKVEPSLKIKLLGYLARTPWVWRQVMKGIAAGAAILTAWLNDHGAERHSEAMVAGASAAAIWIFEQFVSWLSEKAKMPRPVFFEDGEQPEPAVRSLTGLSPFLPAAFPQQPEPTQPMNESTHDQPRKRPSVFTSTDEPESIPPQPRRIQPGETAYSPFAPAKPKRPPLGVKGARIIAESKQAPATAPPDVVRGNLCCDADEGRFVLIEDAAGEVKTLRRDDWDFFVLAE